jgi:hypothetical protein
MWRFYAALALLGVTLSPPLFTAGACTAEYESQAARIEADRAALRTPESAMNYWRSRLIPAALLTPEDCRRAKPSFLDRCGPGPLVYARVPVNNWVCRLYRDDEVRVQLRYDDPGRLLRIQTDMNPFKLVRLPYVDTTVYWAR